MNSGGDDYGPSEDNVDVPPVIPSSADLAAFEEANEELLADIFTDKKYETAYEGILTPDELKAAKHEAREFAKDLKGNAGIPRALIRGIANVSFALSPSGHAMANNVKRQMKKAEAKGRDYSDVVGEVFDSEKHTDKNYAAKLNYQQFRLDNNGERLHRVKNAEEISVEMFKPGHEKEWKTLVLVSNSNFVSPQSFFDCFDSARQVVSAAAGVLPEEMVVAGTYFSQRNMAHNAWDSINRYNALKKPESFAHMSPAAEIQYYQLLDLLLERNGESVTVEGNRPLLRADAAEVMKHVVCYGYSAAHMTNKDAFRTLRDLLADGGVVVQDGEGKTHESTLADAERILSGARVVGLAGMDRMGPQQRGMPREVNFVHRGDLSLSLLGSRFFKAPGNICLKTPGGRDAEPLEREHGGHAQHDYVEALLNFTNDKAITDALARLSGNDRAR